VASKQALASKQARWTSTYIITFTFFLSENWGMLNLDSQTLLLSKDPICVLFRSCPKNFGIFTPWYQFVPVLVHPRPPRGPAQKEITKNCFFDWPVSHFTLFTFSCLISWECLTSPICFFWQWANLIGPSQKKKKVETMEAPQNRRFYGKMVFLPLWPTPI
jgi:hypothetical protein